MPRWDIRHCSGVGPVDISQSLTSSANCLIFSIAMCARVVCPTQATRRTP